MRATDLGPRVLAAAALAVCTTGCRGSQSALDPKGPQAERIYELWNVMFIGSIVVMAVVVVLLACAIVLPRGPTNEKRRLRWVLFGAGATVAILIALIAYNTTTAKALAEHPDDPLQIRVVGRQWWWDFTYLSAFEHEQVRTANELTIPAGRPVRVTLESYDVIHSFWVPNIQGKRDAIPGRTNYLWFQADTPGVYRGQCGEFCGLQHAKMAFVVNVVPPAEFDAWLQQQRQIAAAPATERARRGQEVFLQSCATCHEVRGTVARAKAGPDLTHLASRTTIAAGSLANVRGSLGGWILDPQHVKPGAYMPPVELDAERVHALLDYLESLR
jgi:cytochrome c oxidase subunit II